MIWKINKIIIIQNWNIFIIEIIFFSSSRFFIFLFQ